MLTCLPQSLCSWDFRVPDAASGPAALTFNFFSEQGSLTLGGLEHSVRKHGPLSGHWTLERAGAVSAEARKPNALSRSFEVRCGDAPLRVEAQSASTRSFNLLAAGSVVGTIQPAHPFTRRAFIECGAAVPELAQLFSFWLVVVTWRRAANDRAATST